MSIQPEGNVSYKLNKETYYNRFVNERVETELMEFKKEIRDKFKQSTIKNFVFPRSIPNLNSNPNNNHIKRLKANSRLK